MRKAVEIWFGSVVVYVAMAACAGGGHVAERDKPQAGAGEPAVAAGGVPDVTASGAPGREAGAPPVGAGGLLDPVTNAGAQEGGATGAAPAGAALTYTKHVVDCSSLIKITGTNWPAAVLDIEPPSPIVAATTVHVMTAQPDTFPGGWTQAGPGGLIQPDGSQVGVQCVKATDSVVFYVPSF